MISPTDTHISHLVFVKVSCFPPFTLRSLPNCAAQVQVPTWRIQPYLFHLCSLDTERDGHFRVLPIMMLTFPLTTSTFSTPFLFSPGQAGLYLLYYSAAGRKMCAHLDNQKLWYQWLGHIDSVYHNFKLTNTRRHPSLVLHKVLCSGFLQLSSLSSLSFLLGWQLGGDWPPALSLHTGCTCCQTHLWRASEKRHQLANKWLQSKYFKPTAQQAQLFQLHIGLVHGRQYSLPKKTL